MVVWRDNAQRDMIKVIFFCPTSNYIYPMKTSIEIQNLKFGGCATAISHKLNTLKDVGNVSIDVENSTVYFDHTNIIVFQSAKKTLTKLGYPLIDKKNSFGQKTKSYISCVIGKIGG
jgi:copper chaperone